MRTMSLLVLVGYSAVAAVPVPEVKIPLQAARGQAIFFDENLATHCGACHSLAQKGTAVGPDLSRLARLNPRAIVTAIRATRTQYVQTVKLRDGHEFPGMPGAKDGTSVQYYDLGSMPPVARNVETKDIASTADNATWKHPPESAGYTVNQLADVIAYIRWASYGDTKGVKPDEIE